MREKDVLDEKRNSAVATTKFIHRREADGAFENYKKGLESTARKAGGNPHRETESALQKQPSNLIKRG